MELFGYYRSSAAYRVRIALNYKGIAYTSRPLNLLKAEHRSEEYLAINPQGLIPALRLDDGRVLTQSTAILEWLEHAYPDPALYPEDIWQRTEIRAVTNTIACDIHPINNLRVLNYLAAEFGAGDEQKAGWYRHWLKLGFDSLEPRLQANPYSFEGRVTMADVYLIPQVYNALRYELDMSAYPRIETIYAACSELEAFRAAAPEQQADAN